VLALGVLGACAIVLPFVGLGTRVAWTELPTLLTSQAATRALGLSLRTCVIATVISVCLGVPLALLLARQWRGVRVGRVLAVLPMTMPPVVAGIALLATLGKRGLLGRTLSVMDVQISFTTTAVVIAQVFVAMPYLVVTLEAALRSRDTHVETIARTLGAGPWTLLTRITLPLVGPALARGTALALGRSLGEFGATIAFAGSKEGVTRTMPLAIYLERENDTATSLALAVVLIAMSFLIVGATNISWPELVRRLPHPSHPSRRAQMSSPRSTTASRPVPTAPRGLDLHVSFASAQRNVTADLEVGAGRTLALIGPNGSGKSTVCGVVAGLLDAENGHRLLLYDDAQTIYKKSGAGLGFTLSSVGIKAQGRTTILRLNYRNTKEIIGFAYLFAQNKMQPHESGEDGVPLVEPEAAGVNGISPYIKECPDWQGELDYLARCLDKWLKDRIPPQDIAVICYNKEQCNDVAKLLKQKGICHSLHYGGSKKAYNPHDNAVAVFTMHSSKGLEFQRVMLMGICTLKHKDANQEADNTRLLYVAMTRAQNYLMITLSGSGLYQSRLLDSYRQFKQLNGNNAD